MKSANELLNQYKLKSPKILQPFEPFVKECQSRLRINPYKGCFFQCKFCYIKDKVEIRTRNFSKYLDKDIEIALSMGLNIFPVMVSCSTDSLQPIENEYHFTKYSFMKLADACFSLIIPTQNPQYLLQNKEYMDILKKTKSVIEVTIPSIKAGPEACGIFKTNAPPSLQRLIAMEKIVQEGLPVRLRLEPIIPDIKQDGGVPLQTEEDIDTLVYEFARIIEKAHKSIGKDMIIITNTMTWSENIRFKDEYREFYLKNGIEYVKDENFKIWFLNPDIEIQLLSIVYQKCIKYNIPFSPCVHRTEFLNSCTCDFPNLCDGV